MHIFLWWYRRILHIENLWYSPIIYHLYSHGNFNLYLRYCFSLSINVLLKYYWGIRRIYCVPWVEGKFAWVTFEPYIWLDTAYFFGSHAQQEQQT
jgi:hypothetical protein